MNINIIAKEEWLYGWSLNYIESLQKIPNVNVTRLKTKNYHFPFDKWFQDYVSNPLYVVKKQKDDNIIHFLETYQGHFIHFLKNKTIITCQDIYHSIINDFNGRKKLFYELSISGMLKANIIITGSEHTKNDLIKYLHVQEDKIRVIPFGVDINKFKPLYIKDCKKIKLVLNVGLKENEDRKNISGVLKAFCELKKSIPVKLIQVGADESKFRDLIYKYRIQKDVIFTGIISERQLIFLYNIADVFVFPSFFEGFGVPPLEAMACGCPVIASNVSSLPEILGNSGIMIDPYDINSLSDNMYKVLTDERTSKFMIEKGLNRAKNFTWERTTHETKKLYEEIQNGQI